MENDKKNLVSMLISGAYDDICTIYKLLPFQAKILEYYYKNLKSIKNRETLILNIISGYYSSDEKTIEMAKTYCSEKILNNYNNAINFLIECGYSNEDANSFVQRYYAENKALNDMLSMEVDVSNKNIIMDYMINEVATIFLERQRSKKL